MDGITSVEAKGDEGTIQATVRTLDESALNQSTGKIIGFYDTVCRYREPL